MLNSSIASTPLRGPLIMGGSGRLGRALAAVWPKTVPQPVWQNRYGAGGLLAWDILNEAPPKMPSISGVVVLAGLTHGSTAALAVNTQLAKAGVHLGRERGVPVLVASTQAVYGPQRGQMCENMPLLPQSDYGRAKLAMETAVAGPNVTCLRIGNVAGCDALANSMARGSVILDRFADGHGPRRAMLGPWDLFQIIQTLLAMPVRPPVLNVARPGLVAMADMLRAAQCPFVWRDAPSGALQELAMNVDLLQTICPTPPANAVDMVAQGGLA
ncbi:NAD-dependent epimerase/dehydratase family protein [Loktanella salsilacus]|uniref:NAD-dependent epimerase/dehydratase family protein n=1 Tax=Loktanella salsilacus TaxID=195913 RepID=UPI0030033EFC